MTSSDHHTQHYNFSLNVLGFEDKSEFSVVALELDIWGFGSSEELALADLSKDVRTQIEFALARGSVELFSHETESRHFEEFQACRFAQYRGEKTPGRFLRSLPYPVVDFVEFAIL
jgi:hypothetical protein